MSHKIAEFNSRKDGIRLHASESDGWYPVCCFELLPSSSSKKDKLIAEARKRYPKGTYFLSAKSGDRIEACELYSYDTKEDMLTDDGWAVYSKGKWAVVDGRVSTRFDIGDKVIGNGLADDEGYDVTNAGWIGYVYKINGEEIKVGYTSDEKERVYFPDIYIKSINKIIEVKSEWTIKLQSARIDDRAKSVKEAGYDFEVWVYSVKKIRTETLIF